MNRAERRLTDRCKHNWRIKEWGDGVGFRYCLGCGCQEWHDSVTRFAVARDASASGGVR